MGHLDNRPQAPDRTGQEAEPGPFAVLVAALEEELVAEADPEQCLAAAGQVGDEAVETALLQLLAGGGKGAHTGQDQTICGRKPVAVSSNVDFGTVGLQRP